MRQFIHKNDNVQQLQWIQQQDYHEQWLVLGQREEAKDRLLGLDGDLGADQQDVERHFEDPGDVHGVDRTFSRGGHHVLHHVI